jgi:hypothetical protein
MRRNSVDVVPVLRSGGRPAPPAPTVSRVPEIAERTLELAKEALAEQERRVADLRSRGATLLAAGGVVGSLLGKEVFAGSRPDGFCCWLLAGIGLAGAVGLVGCGLGLLTPGRLAFSVEADRAFTWWFERGVLTQPSVDLDLADFFTHKRAANASTVRMLHRCLGGASISLVLLTTGLASALAVA